MYQIDFRSRIPYVFHICTEARRSLVDRPVFKTGGGDEKSPRWVRFPCASAILFVFYLTRQIFSISEKAKVIMCSSHGHEDLVNAALESGASEIMSKSHRINRLQEVIQITMHF
jgi:hypothetical protein